MNKAMCDAQMAHLRRAIAALRLLDLNELEECLRTHGTQADRDLLAAIMLALETLPNDPHG
jgi:hypothetical protein